MLVFSAADFEDFLEPRPDLPTTMEAELTEVVTLLAKNRWPFRLHATYDETIAPLPRRLRGGEPGRAVRRPALVLRPRRDDLRAEHRAGQGARRRHRRAAPHGLPGRVLHRPLRREGGRAHSARSAEMLQDGRPGRRGHRRHARRQLQPVGLAVLAGHGKTVGGTPLYPEANRLDRTEALRRYTSGSAWFSGEEDEEGPIEVGQLADLAVLSADYFSVPEEEIKRHRVGADGGRRQGGVRGRGLRQARPAAAARQPGLVAGGRYGGYHRPPRAGLAGRRPAACHRVGRPPAIGSTRAGRRSRSGATGCGAGRSEVDGSDSSGRRT